MTVADITNVEEYCDQGYQNIWDITLLESTLTRIIGCTRQFQPMPITANLPRSVHDKFRLAQSIMEDPESCDPMVLLHLSVCESTPVAMAARRALVLHPALLERMHADFITDAAEALSLMPEGATHLIRLIREILRKCGKIDDFPVEVFKYLSTSLRKNRCLVDNEGIAPDRPLTQDERNVHEIACILELPAAARVAVPLLLRLPLSLRRIHAASFLTIWRNWPSFREIKKDLSQLDPALADFLKDRIDV